VAEVAPQWAVWRKSALSGGSNCVEMAVVEGRVLVRDSKDPLGPRLSFTPAEWAAFLAGVKSGDFEFDPGI
jgi:Domain of unknown function (DUF397)